MRGGGSDGGVGDGHETHSIFSGRSGGKGTLTLVNNYDKNKELTLVNNYDKI
jgi:hypothetical protein